MIPNQNVFVQLRVINGVRYIAKNYEVFELDEIGMLVWELIDGQNSIDQIINQISLKYNVPKGLVTTDVQAFMDDLLANGLIEV